MSWKDENYFNTNNHFKASHVCHDLAQKSWQKEQWNAKMTLNKTISLFQTKWLSSEDQIDEVFRIIANIISCVSVVEGLWVSCYIQNQKTKKLNVQALAVILESEVHCGLGP